jgi:hypothetical protein
MEENKMETYYVRIKTGEDTVDFHTRVVNELMTMKCKIHEAFFGKSLCSIRYSDLEGEPWSFEDHNVEILKDA